MEKEIKKLEKLKESIASFSDNAKKVRDACSDIDKSWSGSSFATHGKYYFKNYEEPSSRNRFNIEWGLVRGVPEGWTEKSNEQISKEIENRTKVSLSDLKQKASDFQDRFKSLKRELVLVLVEAGVDISDIENFKLKNATDYFNDIFSTPRMTRDSAAATSGIYIVPHLYFQATASFIISVPSQIDELLFRVKKAIKLYKGTRKKVAKESSKEKTYDAGDSFEFLLDVALIVKKAKKKIFIIDPYINDGVLECLFKNFKPKSSVEIKIMQAKNSSISPLLMSALNSKKNIKLIVKNSDKIHDRVLFIDDRCWKIGQSLKDAAKEKPTYCIELKDQDVITATYDIYDTIWENSQLILCDI